MTLYYSLVFGLMVSEMFIFVLLILPLPMKWRKSIFIFLSKSPLIAQLQYGLKITFIFVFILFVDSLNRMWRVQEEASHQDGHHVHDVRTETNLQARKFYSQRNMYLTGFTLFLSLILNRTYVLIIDQLRAEEQLEVLKKQAANQSKEYTRLNGSESDLQKKLAELTKDLENEKLKSRDFETLKKQAQGSHDEYMRLADKHNELERKASGQIGDSKKAV